MIKTLKKLALITTATLLTTLPSLAGTGVKAMEDCNCKQPCLSIDGSLGVDFLSNFTFRGTVLDRNPVVRPYLGLSVPLPVGGGVFDAASLNLSVAQALTTKGASSRWSRTDASVGVAVVKGDFTVTTSYQVVTSPNNTFNTADGVAVRVDYNDEGLCPILPALKPHVEAYFGLNNNPGNSTAAGAVGNYYEVGIAPSTEVLGNKVSVPVNVGFGAGGYYTGGKNYGYASAGVQVSREIATNTTLTAGVTYLNSNDNVNSNKNNWISTIGLRYSF